jgi:hypothetical protein
MIREARSANVDEDDMEEDDHVDIA